MANWTFPGLGHEHFEKTIILHTTLIHIEKNYLKNKSGFDFFKEKMGKYTALNSLLVTSNKENDTKTCKAEHEGENYNV